MIIEPEVSHCWFAFHLTPRLDIALVLFSLARRIPGAAY
jgi:hypothetical protein